MNKTLTSLLFATALLPMSAFAGDAIGVYVAPKLGYGSVHSSFKYGGFWDDKIGSQTEGTAVLGVAVGYDFKRKLSVPVRVELESASMGDTSKKHYVRSLNEDNKTTLGVSTLFVNTYFDFHNPSAFTPYVSLGLGNSYLSAKARAVEREFGGYNASFCRKTTSNFAWNVGVGAAWNISDRIALDLGYRYANLGKAKTKYARESGHSYPWYIKAKDVETHQFLLGTRFTF